MCGLAKSFATVLALSDDYDGTARPKAEKKLLSSYTVLQSISTLPCFMLLNLIMPPLISGRPRIVATVNRVMK